MGEQERSTSADFAVDGILKLNSLSYKSLSLGTL
jgi:hypothetical protein